jgi:hypothetical protein
MKKTIALTITFLTCFHLFSHTKKDSLKKDSLAPRHWQLGGTGGINFTQSQFNNWAAGGQNSLSATALFAYGINYKKEKQQWDNSFDFAYGFLRQNTDPFRKNDDRLELNSKFGYKGSKKWYYSFLINFKSQFAPGYDYPNDSIISSDFMAPAYLLLSLGMDYKPSDNFSLYLSPVTGKITFVNNQTLADAGKFGVEKAVTDTLGNVLIHGKNIRYEFGAYITLKWKKEVMKNVTFSTKVDLFSNYLNNIGNIDVNWDCLFDFKINKHISASITTGLIYDHDIKVPVYEQIGAQKIKTHDGPRIQFKEVLAIGLTKKF